eukprot:scaffold121285_cov57-Phaeocystis_antarctica.AAC.1
MEQLRAVTVSRNSPRARAACAPPPARGCDARPSQPKLRAPRCCIRTGRQLAAGSPHRATPRHGWLHCRAPPPPPRPWAWRRGTRHPIAPPTPTRGA